MSEDGFNDLIEISKSFKERLTEQTINALEKENLVNKYKSLLTRKQRRKILKLKGISYSKYVYELFKDVKI